MINLDLAVLLLVFLYIFRRDNKNCTCCDTNCNILNKNKRRIESKISFLIQLTNATEIRKIISNQ